MIPRFRESESNFEAKWRTQRAFFGKSVIQCVEREPLKRVEKLVERVENHWKE